MDDFSKAIDECLKILEENVDILADLEVDLEDEKENEIVPNLELHQLYDIFCTVAVVAVAVNGFGAPVAFIGTPPSRS